MGVATEDWQSTVELFARVAIETFLGKLPGNLRISFTAHVKLPITHLHADPELGEAEMREARRELLRAQRSALLNLQHSGVLSDEGLEKLASEIDEKLDGSALSSST